MNTEATTESIQSTSQPTISNESIFYFLDKMKEANDPIMRQVYYNTLKRLLHGKLETP